MSRMPSPETIQAIVRTLSSEYLLELRRSLLRSIKEEPMARFPRPQAIAMFPFLESELESRGALENLEDDFDD
ncbi:MAG: hypothetical protein OWQ59_05140 [Alicyclobacillaceae bacterium]|jgi:hypothetical protein|uniref:hypothetical protein n=1 Tax=Alicyclobacillus sp. SP_1 TaxID=2942475 RepID=UPI00215872B3|nr:hypothetical protein [Alicyclobacillus sp. SP_1]MCY0887824.1 hypothetical protein [Alicyclobacillaceae bacterium]MCY0896103.1 hypothetical protein [Alicyclobacillaceae bacterium]